MKAAPRSDPEGADPEGAAPEGAARGPAATGIGSSLMTTIKIGALVFALVLGAVAVAAWFSGEPETLSFDYEGFD